MFTAETLATHLHAAGIVTFDPDGDTGNTYIHLVPDRPDVAVTVSDLGGEHDPAVGEATTTLQVRARGSRGEQTAPRNLLNEVAVRIAADGYSGPAQWAPGTPYEARVIYAKPTMPGTIGWDDNGRPEASMRVTVRWVTPEPNL